MVRHTFEYPKGPRNTVNRYNHQGNPPSALHQPIMTYLPSRLRPNRHPHHNKHHPRSSCLLRPLSRRPLPLHPPPNRANGLLRPALRLPQRPPRMLPARLRQQPHHEPRARKPLIRLPRAARLHRGVQSGRPGPHADAELAQLQLPLGRPVWLREPGDGRAGEAVGHAAHHRLRGPGPLAAQPRAAERGGDAVYADYARAYRQREREGAGGRAE